MWEAEGTFSAKGEVSGSLMTLCHVDLTRGAQHSVFSEEPVPRINQHPSVALLLVEDDCYFLKVFDIDCSIKQIIV